jgi:hypothetical protein
MSRFSARNGHATVKILQKKRPGDVLARTFLKTGFISFTGAGSFRAAQ